MSSPKIEVDVYGYNNKPAPAAADIRRGATDPGEIQEATDAVRELSNDLSNRSGRQKHKHVCACNQLTNNRYEKIHLIQDFACRIVDCDSGKHYHNNALTTVQP
jgi:hypothetical protein